VKIRRNGVLAIPATCVTKRGEDRVVFLNQNGKARQARVRLGPSDGTWVELVGLEKDGKFAPGDPGLELMAGDLDELQEGQEVKIVRPEKDGAKVKE